MITQAGTPCKWTHDSQKFLLRHFNTIYDTPSQVYYSTLPSSSWLHEYYGGEPSWEVLYLDPAEIPTEPDRTRSRFDRSR